MEKVKANNPFEFIFEIFTPNEFCNIFASEKYQTRAYILSFSQNKDYPREVMNIYNDNDFSEIVSAYLGNVDKKTVNFVFAQEVSDYLDNAIKEGLFSPDRTYKAAGVDINKEDKVDSIPFLIKEIERKVDKLDMDVIKRKMKLAVGMPDADENGNVELIEMAIPNGVKYLTTVHTKKIVRGDYWYCIAYRKTNAKEKTRYVLLEMCTGKDGGTELSEYDGDDPDILMELLGLGNYEEQTS
jgi:hypothetical protein